MKPNPFMVALIIIIVISLLYSRIYFQEGLFASKVVTTKTGISDTQYYCLVAILKDIEIKDPSLSNSFGLNVINLLNIIDPKYTTVLGDSNMLMHEKLVKLMNVVKTVKPVDIPPFTVMQYNDVSFGAHT